MIRLMMGALAALCFVTPAMAQVDGPIGKEALLTANGALSRTASITDPQFGAKCDVVIGSSVSSTAGSPVFTMASQLPSSAKGKLFFAYGAGPGGGPFVSTIASVGTNSITANANASTTTSPSTVRVGFATTATPGSGYAPGDTIALAGGVGTSVASLTVQTTKVVSATLVSGGSGATSGGTQTVWGTTGTGAKFSLSVTVTGGAITAINSISYAGVYTANPTTLTLESVSGDGLTGATVSLAMGVNSTLATSPGAYSASPTNPTSPASTSGGGTGATFTVVPVADGGWQYGTDDTNAIQAAASSNLAQSILFPRTPCAITSGILFSKNFTRFATTGGGSVFHDVGVSAVIPGGLTWLSSNAGTMITCGPSIGGSNPDQSGCGLSALGLLGNTLAGTGLLVSGERNAQFNDLYIESTTGPAAVFTSAGGSLGEVTDDQHILVENMAVRNFLTVGPLLQLTGSASSSPHGNASFVMFLNFSGQHAEGNGIDCLDADNVTMIGTQIYGASGADGVALNAAALTGGACRDNRWIGFTGNKGIYFHGTETGFGATTANFIIGPDVTNNDPAPFVGNGAQGVAERPNGHIVGAILISPVSVPVDAAAGPGAAACASFGFPYSHCYYSTSQSQIALADGTHTNMINLDSNGYPTFTPVNGGTKLNLSKVGAITAVNLPGTGSTYAQLSANDMTDLDTSTNAIAVALRSGVSTGEQYGVCDLTGHAAAHNITITPAAGLIDGSATYVISTNYGCWRGQWTGTIWKTLWSH